MHFSTREKAELDEIITFEKLDPKNIFVFCFLFKRVHES